MRKAFAVLVVATAVSMANVTVGYASPLVGVTFIGDACDTNSLAGSSGPITIADGCSRNPPGSTITAQYRATADYGLLGSGTFLTSNLASVNVGLTEALFIGEYVFAGAPGFIDVRLNLDFEGLLNVFANDHSGATVRLQAFDGHTLRRLDVAMASDGPAFDIIENSLAGSVDFSPLLVRGQFASFDILTDSFSVPTNSVVQFQISLTTRDNVRDTGFAVADFASTLTFNRDGDVFTVPDGYTVNGTAVTNNRWDGARASVVSEPGMLALVGLGLVFATRRNRRAHV